jgi:hypothetical protein
MSDSIEIAALKARVDAMEADVTEIKGDVKAIRSKTDKWSGVVAIVVLSAPALLGTAFGWFLSR